MVMTIQERMKSIEKAIEEIENGGQEIRYNGQLLRRGDIGLLYAERRRLQEEMKIENAGNDGWSIAVFHR